MAALCVRCKKNQAVLFVSRMENGEMKSEGYCLKCAKELGMKPIDDVLNNLGLKEEDLDAICEQANELLGGELMNVDQDNSNIGETGTDNILRRLYGNLFPHALQKSEPSAQEQAGPTGPNRQPRQGGKNQEKKYLNAFCIDLTAKAKAGQLDGLIGRETELQRTMQILNRRLKNNPCLIGEPGVGKTAIVEGLAQQIARGNAPYKLLDKEIWQLDMTALVAGTQYRGQMEGRMKGLLDEIKVLGNIILFIDEVHSIVGAGDAEGGMNAANILKPALSRGDIQVIGATTFTEYRKHIEKDSALERRFQPVTVEEPSIEDSIAIASGVAHYYEAYHSVVIPKAMARQAVLLSERYITDRYLPDKAIDLIDEAAADLNLNSPVCREMESLNSQLNALKAEAAQLLLGDLSPETEERLAAVGERHPEAVNRCHIRVRGADYGLADRQLARLTGVGEDSLLGIALVYDARLAGGCCLKVSIRCLGHGIFHTGRKTGDNHDLAIRQSKRRHALVEHSLAELAGDVLTVCQRHRKRELLRVRVIRLQSADNPLRNDQAALNLRIGEYCVSGAGRADHAHITCHDGSKSVLTSLSLNYLVRYACRQTFNSDILSAL